MIETTKDTIQQIFGYRAIKADLGIEVEVESNEPIPHAVRDWIVKADGSLRGAFNAEYVTKPILIRDVGPLVKELKSSFTAMKAEVAYNIRAGVHVHINCLDLTFYETVKFAACFYIFESGLINFCGEDRIGNLFCLRSSDAEYVIFRLIAAMKHNTPVSLGTDNIRYSSLNWKALCDYGTLEFRSMSTLPNFEKVEEWCNILHQIKNFSLEFKTLNEVVEKFSIWGANEFAMRGLTKYYDLIYPNGLYLEDCLDGMRTAQDLAFYKYL